jgi:hypothetical protein
VAFAQDVKDGVRPVLTLKLDVDEVPLDFGRKFPDAEAEYVIDLDRQALENDPAIMTLGLYDGVRLEAHRFMSKTYAPPVVGPKMPGWKSWAGRLYFPDVFGVEMPAGVVILNDHGTHVSGMIQIEATLEDFLIVGKSTGEHRLIRIKRDRKGSCGMRSMPQATSVAGSSKSTAATERSTTLLGTLNLLSDPVITVVGFMSAYDEYLDWYDTITDMVSQANVTLGNSDVDAEFSYLGTYVSGYDGPSLPDYDYARFYLNWMNYQGHSTVESYRGAADADMAVIFIPSVENDVCGVANLRHLDGTNDAFADYWHTGLDWDDFDQPAYSVTVLGCSIYDYVFAHELGHNFGLRHDVTDENEDPNDWGITPISDDPRGHEFSTWLGYRATVMGCWGETAPCYRTYHFSNPAVDFALIATGNESNPYNANAASALNSLAAEYEALR